MEIQLQESIGWFPGIFGSRTKKDGTKKEGRIGAGVGAQLKLGLKDACCIPGTISQAETLSQVLTPQKLQQQEQ